MISQPGFHDVEINELSEQPLGTSMDILEVLDACKNYPVH